MKKFTLALLFLALPEAVFAQARVLPEVGTGNTAGGSIISQPVGTCTGCAAMPITGSFSATIAGFTPNGNYATATAPSGSSSAATNLPTGATAVLFQNTGTNTASVNFGATSATANNLQVPSNSTVFATVPTGATQFTAFGEGGSTTLVVVGGAGLGTSFGGGSSGGSGSNASVGSTGASVPASATYLGVNVGGNLTGWAMGTAGSPSTQVVSIQGVASGTAVPVSGTFFQATQPISATALPLPSGASTSALQTTGNSSLATIATNTGLSQGSTTSGQAGILNLAAVTTSSPTYTTGQTSALPLDTSGNLRVNVVAGGGSGGTSSSFSATFPATGTAIGAKNGANMVNLTADASNNLNIDCAAGCGVAQASTTSGQTGSLVMGAVTTADPTYTTAQTNSLSLATTGGLRIVGDGTVSAGTAQVGSLLSGLVYNSTAPAPTSGQQIATQADPKGSLFVDIAARGATSATNKGGSITTGGTAVQVDAAPTTKRTYLLIENPCTATSQGIGVAESLFVAFAASAAANSTSIELGQCGSLVQETGFIDQGTISVNAATSSHKFVAWIAEY